MKLMIRYSADSVVNGMADLDLIILGPIIVKLVADVIASPLSFIWYIIYLLPMVLSLIDLNFLK